MTYSLGTAEAAAQQQRMIAIQQMNELHAKAMRLAQDTSAVTRSTSFSAGALRGALNLVNRAARSVGLNARVTLSRDQYVSTIQAAVVQMIASTYLMKRMVSVSSDATFARLYPHVAQLAATGDQLDRSVRALVADAMPATATSGMGLPILLPYVGAAVAVSVAVYVAYERGRTDNEQAARLAREAVLSICGPSDRDQCGGSAGRLEVYMGAFRAHTETSMERVVNGIVEAGEGLVRETGSVFKGPVLAVAIIGGVAVTVAAGYALWPYLKTVRTGGQRMERAARGKDEDND